jgi:hypothetical protein
MKTSGLEVFHQFMKWIGERVPHMPGQVHIDSGGFDHILRHMICWENEELVIEAEEMFYEWTPTPLLA